MSSNINEMVSLIDDVRFRSGDADEPHLFNPSGGMHGFEEADDEEKKTEVDEMGNCVPHFRRFESSSDDDLSTGSSDSEPIEVEDPSEDHSAKLLMPPRQRPLIRVRRLSPKSKWRRILWGGVYAFVFGSGLAAFVCIVVYFVNTYANKLLLEKFHSHFRTDDNNATLTGCNEISVEDVWVQGIPKLITESAFRMMDVNQDGALDVVFGFGTGGQKLKEDPVVCEIYFKNRPHCGGGIMALDGKTGEELWAHYAPHEIFSVNCNADINSDGVNDCIGGGRAGTFEAVSGADGKFLWNFNGTAQNSVMNLYTGQFIPDRDQDGIPDVLNIHGGDPLGEPGSETRLAGKLMFFSGRTGKVLSWSWVPDNKESYYSPVVYNRNDGTPVVLLGTGGETHGGSLYMITLDDLYKGAMEKAIALFTDPYKGMMTPPVLIDLTSDGIRDIVFSTFNSTVVAIDGDNFKILWNASFPQSETYATPAPGYYNDDDIPDFMVRWQYGPGFPIYYHSVMTILDGRDGRPLLDPYPRDSVGAQTSPLTLSAEGRGNDLFLYWIADCVGHEGDGGEFGFRIGANVHEKSRADVCKSRFKSDGFSRQYAHSQRTGLPGGLVYDSMRRKEVEHSAWENTTAVAWEFLLQNPKHMQQYELWLEYVEKQKEAWRKGDKKEVDLEDTESESADYPLDRDESNEEPALRVVPEDNKFSGADTLSSDYSGVGGYGYRPGSRGYHPFDARKLLLPSNDDNHGRNTDSKYMPDQDNGGYYGNKYDGDVYDTDYNPTQFNNLISNILQTNYERNNQRNDPPAILRNTNHNERRVPVRDWSRWNYANSDVMGNYGYGHRGRRGIALAPDKKVRHVKRDTKNVKAGYLRKHKVVPNRRNRHPHHSNKAHKNIEEMTLEEIHVKLQNTLQKVTQIREREIKRKFRKEHEFQNNEDENKTTETSENVNNNTERNPSNMPKATVVHANLPISDNSNIMEKSQATEESGTTDSVNNTTSNSEKLLDTFNTANLHVNETVHNVENRTVQNPIPNDGIEKKRKGSGGEGKDGIKVKKRRRKKRHVGPHDGGGLQRLISTGTLAPSLLDPSHPDYVHSMDVIFATYWFFPAKTEVLLPEDQACIQGKLKRETVRFDPRSKYYGMDHDAYQHEIEEECLEESGHKLPDDKTYESQMTFNPYDLHMGQMTVYRIRIKCKCKENDATLKKEQKRCAKILPFDQQQWAAYMGSHGDSHWLPRKSDNNDNS